MNTDTFWQVLTGAIILAIIFMLVRPNSPAASAVASVSGALTALVTTATGVAGPTVNNQGS
jgi:hypothetical protein